MNGCMLTSSRNKDEDPHCKVKNSMSHKEDILINLTETSSPTICHVGENGHESQSTSSALRVSQSFFNIYLY